MVKFKLRIFRSCHTKHSSPPPEHSSPPSQRQLTGELPCTLSPSPHRSSFKTHISSAFRCASRSGKKSATKDFHTHVSTKPYDAVSPPFYEKKTRCTRSKDTGNLGDGPPFSHRFSTSYTIDDGGEDDQPRRSFSDVGVRSRHHNSGGDGEVSPEWGSPARLSVFKKLMPCKVEGKVKESFAAVKRSEKPYEDFKKSMMEMIVENEMYEESDLKQLLECFLSLNSWYHHGVIVEAFSEIWNTVFLDR